MVLGVIAWIKRRQLRQPELVDIVLLSAAAGFVLSLGIQLHWLGRQVASLPRVLQPIFHRVDMPVIYLPAYYLYLYLPFFSKMRVMMRFGLFTLIFTSLLAGLGAYLLTKTASLKVKGWVGIVLLVLVFIDFYPGVLEDFRVTQARPVDSWLAAQPNTGALAQFPFTEESSQGLVYDTLVNQKPFLGGYFNANSPEQYTHIAAAMTAFPSQASVNLLKKLGVSYVVVDSSQYENFPTTDQKIQSLGLKLLQVSDVEYVYGLSK